MSILIRSRGVVVALALAAALPAYAQQTAPAKPAAPAAAAPAPAAPAPAAPAELTPAHVAAARDVIFATGISRSFDAMIVQALEDYKASVLITQPNLRADLEAAIADVDAKTRSTDVGNMQVIAAMLLARRMTEAELKDTLTFFNSPAGKKYVETQPRFLEDLVPAMQGWQARAVPGAVEQVRAIMNQKGHKL